MRALCLAAVLGLLALPMHSRADISTLWRSVMLTGSIKPGDHQTLVLELDKRKPRHLLISAVAGGDDAEAQRIGEEIARRALPVSVTRLCASPCAEHIFLRAAKRKLDTDAFVLFMPVYLQALREHIDLRRQQGLDSLIGPEMERSVRHAADLLPPLAEQLQQAGISPSLLSFRDQLLRSRIETATAEDAAPGKFEAMLRLVGVCKAWAPTASVLRSLGVAVEAKRDARIEDFPRIKEFPSAAVYIGAPVHEDALAALCRKTPGADSKD